MTPEQIEIVETSFEEVRPIAADAAALFYGRLFELDPNLEPLFKGDLEEQGSKLMAALGAVVGGLRKPKTVLPMLEKLGRDHVAYGVEDRHYDTVGQALLWTLEQGLGEGFDIAAAEAWGAAYALVAETMKNAARASGQAPQRVAATA